MKYFFDTSVLVAVSLAQHQHHERSLIAYLKATPSNGACAAHTLAELYATVTRLPGNQRMSCEQALLFVDDVRGRLSIIALNPEDYYSALLLAADENVTGGTVYDMLLAHCARKVNAEIVYTWDFRDFARLGKDIAHRLRTP